jgi:YidC/Oxa1 family membrane protein insertase
MGAVQFWQTKIQPATADPTQQRIMMIMPLMFAAMSFSFPSGLVLYWLVSTLFTIVQQYATNAMIGPPPRPQQAVAGNRQSATGNRQSAAGSQQPKTKD